MGYSPLGHKELDMTENILTLQNSTQMSPPRKDIFDVAYPVSKDSNHKTDN